MKRFGTVAIAFALFLALGAAPTLAAPALTFTEHPGEVIFDDEENVCLPVLNGSTTDVNSVVHATFNGNGWHFTITETGNIDVLGTTDSGQVPVVGQYTFTGGYNWNAKTGVVKGVATVSGRGTVDGEPFALNMVDRFQGEADIVGEDLKGTISGTTKWDCHDGEGKQTFSYTDEVFEG